MALAAAVASGSELLPKDACVTMVADAYPAAKARAEIVRADETDRQAKRPAAFISRLRGLEAPLIPILLSNGPLQVLSLGSGADVYRPLRDFPTVSDIHLVDVLMGWGKSPAAVFIEVQARLRALAPGAEVKVIARGFTQEFTAGELATRSRYWAKMGSPLRYRTRPFVWEARWSSPSVGDRICRVHLHAVNYHDPDDFPALVAKVTERGPLVGVLVTGAWEPRGVSQETFLRALPRHGTYVFEPIDEALGGPANRPSKAQQQLFEALNFRVEEAPFDGDLRTFVAIRQ